MLTRSVLLIRLLARSRRTGVACNSGKKSDGRSDMREKLTPALVAKKEAAASKRVIYWDESMPGFGLMVTHKGHKSFVVQYRTSGRSRRMHLKAGLTLRDARKEAKAILGAVAKGGDPLGKRREASKPRATH